jgi:phosphohistidine phosphatase
MDLLLWRCAETAKPDDPELGDTLKTPLSERGRKRAQKVACWLHDHQPKGLKVFSSPAMAAVEMARLVCRKSEVSRNLGPDAGAVDVLGAVGWPDEHPAVLVIGHQPALGAIASMLLAGDEAAWTVKKGALWWFSNRTRAGESQTVLRAVMSPEMLREPADHCIEARPCPPEHRLVLGIPQLMPDVEAMVMRNVLNHA